MRSLDAKPRRSGGRVVLLGIAFIGLLALGYAGFAAMRAGEAPIIKLRLSQPAIGKTTQAQLTVQEPLRGVARIRAFITQGEQSIELLDQSYPTQSAYRPWEARPVDPSVTLDIGTETLTGLVEGPAQLTVEAYGAGTWLKDAPLTTEVHRTLVRIKPPKLQVLVDKVFVSQGGCEVVVYSVSESAVKHGVRSREWFFPGYDLPGSPGRKFAFFAAPYDLDDPDQIVVVASDDVGNEAHRPFVDQFTASPFKKDTINVSTRIMERVVPKIAAEVPNFKPSASILESYVAINSEMRKENRARLVEIAKQTEPKFYWSRPFVQMSAKAVSAFADHRTYKHDGKKIDEQFHLGFDLASTARAPIPAANPGKVLLAEYLGIYGNAVVIDHGFGLMSLYAHLSSFEVEAGDVVSRAQVIGRTGATGLALGDHLHFAMLLHGLPVTALEWWDGHWIQDRISLKLGSALPFDPS